MARYPEAMWRPLEADGGRRQGVISRYDVICLHTMVGTLSGTDAYFKDKGYGGTESHFGVGGSWDGAKLDGLIYQWTDTTYRADANLEGNWRTISIETSDGAKYPVPPWTTNQIASLARLVRWLSDTHKIPLVLMRDSKPTTRGVGYHRLGVDPWRTVAGEHWSHATGKECPGNARIAQVPLVIKKAQELFKPVVTPPIQPTPPVEKPIKPTEDDMKRTFLYLSTRTDHTTGKNIVWDTEAVDDGGFHHVDQAQLVAPWNSIGTYTVEAEGGGQVKFIKYNADNDVLGDIGPSSNGVLTVVHSLPKGYRMRVAVVSGTVTSARLTADIRER